MVQNLGSELAVRVASLIQQYSALSMENNTLKQQLLRMKQEKFIVDGKYILMILCDFIVSKSEIARSTQSIPSPILYRELVALIEVLIVLLCCLNS